MKRIEIKNLYSVIGAIAGDIIGSSYELRGYRTKNPDFELFTNRSTYTDDTVMTIAIAKWLLNTSIPLDEIITYFGKKYEDVGYGHSFKIWLKSKEHQPYGSWGNGSAMRVSAVALKTYDLNDVLYLAKETAVVTHNHPEGIKGAQAVATAIFLAKNGFTKLNIKEYIENKFGYNLNRDIIDIRSTYYFDSSCQGSVPEAIIAFLQSSDFEDAIRLAVSLGGDADTQACIAGSIAAPFYAKIPEVIIDKVFEKLPNEFVNVLDDLCKSNICNQASVVFVAKEDIYVNSYIRYTFALAATDLVRIYIPKGTRLLANISNRKCSTVHLVNNKNEIFSNIEKKLKDKYPEMENDYPTLCNGILIKLNPDMYDRFYVSETVDDDIINSILY